MCTQLSADSPLGPQVASSLRYCQLEREETERGRKAGRQTGRQEGRGREGSDGESSGTFGGGDKSEGRAEFGSGKVMENGRDSEERRGEDADKYATREKIGLMA